MKVPQIPPPATPATWHDLANEDFEWQAGKSASSPPIESDYPPPPPTTFDDWERLEIDDD